MPGVFAAARVRAICFDLISLRIVLAFAGVSVPYSGFLPLLFIALFVVPMFVTRVRKRRFAVRATALPTPRHARPVADALLATKAAAKGAGVVVVDRNESEIAARGRWNQDTLVDLGSISKALTGLALASMVNDKKLALDDRLGAYLPLRGPLAERTVQELATHRSGLPRLGQLRRVLANQLIIGSSQPYRSWTAANVVKIADSSKLRVGESTYSNLGFALLGVVLERVADEPLGDVLRSRVFEPAGMVDASMTDDGPRSAPGHDSFGVVVPSWIHTGGAGGVQASLRDMASLGAALSKPRTKFNKAFVLASTPVDSEHTQGLGWAVRSYDDGRAPLIWHNGGTEGYSTCFGVQGRQAWFVAVDRGAGFMADAAFVELRK